MRKVAVVEYGMGNLDSVLRALEECGSDGIITSDPREIERANFIILPGVGAFSKGISNLRSRGLEDVLCEQVLQRKIPVLGICLGMQLFASIGHEGQPTDGLGWLEGEVVRLQPQTATERVPHIGWNEIHMRGRSKLFDGIPDRSNFYFVHSYFLQCQVEVDVVAITPFCGSIASVVQRENIFGTQFHPEKSQKLGFRLLQNFLDLRF